MSRDFFSSERLQHRRQSQGPDSRHASVADSDGRKAYEGEGALRAGNGTGPPGRKARKRTFAKHSVMFFLTPLSHSCTTQSRK